MPKFGVAGYPPAFFRSPYGKDRMRICEWLRAIGLDALEVQMTYGPVTSEARCRDYRREADAHGIKLSVHASYFIVLTSDDPAKVAKSSETLKRTFALSDLLGADAIVLHPGSLYQNADPLPVVGRFVDQLGAALADIGPTDIGLFVETAGKLGQLGSVDDILMISGQMQGVFPCIDFGHVHARTSGSLRSEKAIRSLVRRLESHGCFGPGQRIHFHYTPIDFGPRGEISHKTISDRKLPAIPSDRSGTAEGELYHPRYEPVAEALTGVPADFTIISETSDSQDEGALALKSSYLAAGEVPHDEYGRS